MDGEARKSLSIEGLGQEGEIKEGESPPYQLRKRKKHVRYVLDAEDEDEVSPPYQLRKRKKRTRYIPDTDN